MCATEYSTHAEAHIVTLLGINSSDSAAGLNPYNSKTQTRLIFVCNLELGCYENLNDSKSEVRVPDSSMHATILNLCRVSKTCFVLRVYSVQLKIFSLY
jgi:hypothetical protein